MALPRPEWLSLSQAARYVTDRCSCSNQEAKDALVQAGREGHLEAKGSIPLSAHPDPRKREAHPARRYESLKDVDWNNLIDWNASRIGLYSDVLVQRLSLKTWLDQSRSLGSMPELRRAPPAKIREEITVAYNDAEREGKKPPNLKEIVVVVKAALRAQGFQASGRQIADEAVAEEFKNRRRKPGPTIASERGRKPKP